MVVNTPKMHVFVLYRTHDCIKSTEVRLRVGSQIKVQCMGTINCSKYSSGVKRHITPRMPEDMHENVFD